MPNRSIAANQPQATTRHELALYGKRVLVVEDDDRLYHALKDSLEDFGCEIFGSCVRLSGTLDTVPGSHLDAALIDVEPLGAQTLARMVRRLDERGVPILLITPHSTDELPAPLRPHRRLLKPFTEQELLKGMAETIDTITQ